MCANERCQRVKDMNLFFSFFLIVKDMGKLSMGNQFMDLVMAFEPLVFEAIEGNTWLWVLMSVLRGFNCSLWAL